MTGCPMMDMTTMVWMMGGAAIIWILLVVALLLAIAALWKYLRSTPARPPAA